MTVTSILKGCVAAAGLALTAGAAFADYPEKPVNFIVPWPPGDLEDVLTRMIAEDFQEKYGVAAAVVNKPGGGGGPFPGAIEVANAPADGYTVGSFVIGVPVMGHQIDIPPLTPAKFDPLGIFLTYPFVIATSGDANAPEEFGRRCGVEFVTTSSCSPRATSRLEQPRPTEQRTR